MQVLGSDRELTKTLFNNFGKVLVFIFHGPEESQFLEKMGEGVKAFGSEGNVLYFTISSLSCPETFRKFNVEITPTIIITQTDKKILKVINNPQLDTFFEQVEEVVEEFNRRFQADREVWQKKVEDLLIGVPLMIFIKGTPLEPKCGFTETLLGLMKKHNLDYVYYDIIADESMRYWLRYFKGWPTYPQIYIKGKLYGGLDKFKEGIQNGSIFQEIPAFAKHGTPEDKWREITNNPVSTLLIEVLDELTLKTIQELKNKFGTHFELIFIGHDQELLTYLRNQVGNFPLWLEKKLPS